MKKSMLLGILFLSALLLVSCGESPQEKILGEWGVTGEEGTVTFNSDGTMIFADDDKGKWELSGDQLKVTEGEASERRGTQEGDLSILTVTFISDDIMEWIINDGGPGEIMKIKVIRKK